MRRVTYAALLSTCLIPLPVSAQEDTGGMLVDFLEDTLSGDGRTLKVVGLEGALSSRATIKEIVVSDDDGPWLTITNAVLDWNRLALIRGKFSVNTLSAEEIDIARAPKPSAEAAPPPEPGASTFQVPELPVSVELGEIKVDKLSLGEPLIGRAADLSVLGALSLADGTLDTNLDITRLDRPGDEIKLKAGFANETSQITLDLQVIEDAGGLISTAMNLPDSPPLQLTAKGEGPVDDFTANIGLNSDGTRRVSGQVRLRGVPTPDSEDEKSISFAANVGGDLTPFLIAQYDPFFGTDTRLILDGRSDPDGTLVISELDLTSQALRLEGELQRAADGTWDKLALQGRITPPEGETVLLPTGEPKITLESAQISALLDAASGNTWDLSLTANAIETPDMSLDKATIMATGEFDQTTESKELSGDLQAALDGLNFSDAGLARAVGDTITLDGFFDLLGDGKLRLSEFVLQGGDFSVDADATINGLNSGFEMDGNVALKAADLSRFSDLAGQNLAGEVSATLKGTGTPLGGSFDFTLDARGNGLQSGMAEIDPLLEGPVSLSLDALRDTDGLTVRQFALNGETLSAEAAAKLGGTSGRFTFDGTASFDAQDLSLFSGLAGRDLAGSAKASFDGTAAQEHQSFDLQVSAETRNLQSGMSQIDPMIRGTTTITLDAAHADEALTIRSFDLNGQSLDASGMATITGILDGNYAAEGNIKASASDLSVFSALTQRDLAGSVAIKLGGSGALADQSFDLQLNLDANNLQSGIAQIDKLLTGRTTLKADAANSSAGLDVRAFNLNGTALSAEASGTLQNAGGKLTFNAALDDLGRITTAASGPLKLQGDVARTGSGFDGVVQLDGPSSSFAKLDGAANMDGSADFDFEATLNNLQRYVPEFPGSLTASGNAKRANGIWTIDGKAQGPAEIATTLVGTFNEASGDMDMAAKGQVNIGIANQFISPNQIRGAAQFDLALKGQPGLDALSGTISTSGTSLAIPAASQTLTDIGGSVQLANSRASIDIRAALRAGGNLQVSGPVQLTPPFDTNIAIALNQLVLTDKLIYESSANGQMQFAGALAGDNAVTGRIDIGETNINLNAATGSVGAAPIPDITNLGESRPVYETLERAGLIKQDDDQSKGNSRTALDIDIVVPNKVFVRGRGLNAELGGAINIGGTTAAIAPSGQIELIRGNLDLLGRRLALTKGIVALQGNLTPYIEFESTTTTSDGQATLEISGPLDLPEVQVYSDPERPTEEALAMLLFGNRFSELSPLVIAQMAASLAQLSGAGGDATKGLRKGTGIDTVDIGTDESGAGRFGAGAYLSDNLYTDFTVNTAGETVVNLNLEVTDSITLKGSVDNEGDTGLGVFFERDY